MTRVAMKEQEKGTIVGWGYFAEEKEKFLLEYNAIEVKNPRKASVLTGKERVHDQQIFCGNCLKDRP